MDVTAGDPSVTAWRFVHGKIVREPGGAVTPGFEHQATSISQGMPAGLLPFCRPQEVLSDRSVQALVHPQRERDGALLLRPACCDGRRYMLATCVRARPESGEGGLSRTHTQLATFVFTEADWNLDAPRLIANAGGWLRTEPDTVAFHEAHQAKGDYPLVELGPEQLAEVPPCASGPLPKVGNLLWRLAGALEKKPDESLVCGAADGLDSIGTFLRALAGALALLPQPLRIYLTAAAGFAEVQDRALFALQYLPQAPALPRTESGLFEQMAAQLMFDDPAADQERWQRFWEPDGTGDPDLVAVVAALAASNAWQTAAQARARFADALDELSASRSLTDLDVWLDGRRPEAPARPALDDQNTGVRWIRRLTQRINQCVTGQPCTGLARALVKVATLIDSGAESSEEQARQARYWAQAWRQASASVGFARSVLCWSALSVSCVVDDPHDAKPREIGYLKDFGELRVIVEAMYRAKAESSADAALIDQTLGNQAFNRRLNDLRRRADDILIRHPLAIIDLDASFPALLARRSGDDATRAESLAQTLRAILIAARLYDWTGAQMPTKYQGLADAARRVAERSLKMDLSDADLRHDHAKRAEEDFRALLRRYWQWALAPDGERDGECTLWLDAVALTLALRVGQQGPSEPLRWLFRNCPQSYQETLNDHSDRTKIEPGTKILVDACFGALVPSDAAPVKTAADLFRSLPDLSHLAPEPDDQYVTFQLAEVLNLTILRVLQDQRVRPREWMNDFLPVFSDAIGDWLADPANRPGIRLTRRLLALARLLFEQLLGTRGLRPRRPLTDLFERLELLIERTSARTEDLAGHIDPLATALALCILGWAEADPPEPWPDWRVSLAQAPIRRYLARRLGFPRCAYFAALTPANDGDPQVNAIQESRPRAPPDADRNSGHWSSRHSVMAGGRPYEVGAALTAVDMLGLPPTLAGSDKVAETVKQVIAVGAATTWRSLFDQGRSEREALWRLLKEPVTDEALDTLVALAQSGGSAYRRLIDDETWFTVAFFASLGRDGSPLGQWPIPEPLREALLSNGNVHNTSYALQLGRRIATGPSRIGSRLRGLFEHDDSNRLVVERVLLLSDHRWEQIRQSGREQAVLRLLFLLGLILELNDRAKAPQGRLEISRWKTLRALNLASTTSVDKGAMEAFFRLNPNLADALRQAVELANMSRLTGWPERVQPLSIPKNG